MVKTHWFPVDFPLNQSSENGEFSLRSLRLRQVLRQLLWADAAGDLPLHRALRGGRYGEAPNGLVLKTADCF